MNRAALVKIIYVAFVFLLFILPESSCIDNKSSIEIAEKEKSVSQPFSIENYDFIIEVGANSYNYAVVLGVEE